ncbi:MAG: 23S rRNA (uracil(1939)-C(5))-methyltransferase RlmD [Bdellovibrionota bacterium]
MSTGTEVSVNIRSLAVGGAGVGEVTAQTDGRSDLLGITAFVPYSAIGEQVAARVVQRKERYIQTELLSVTVASEQRVPPPCKLFTMCGGCELQHITYEQQLKAKYEMIYGALRAAKLPMRLLERLHPVVAGRELGYRRRVSLHIDQSGKVGFYREASRSVVATDHCPVAVAPINEVLKNIAEFGHEVRGKISSLLLEADSEGVVAVLKTPYALAASEARAMMDIAKKYFPSALLFAGEKEVSGYGRQILELPLNDRGTLTLRVPAGYFSQVNAEINARLVNRAIELANPTKNDLIGDLYAGAGNFSLPFARTGAKVTAVECDKRLVGVGRENATRYNLQKNLEFVELSVEKFLQRKPRPVFDIALCDPPRSGLGNLVPLLSEMKKIVLVSCHLPSFVRDAKNLCEHGWEADTIVPFDMFAQTSYVEILAVFNRS